MAAAISAWTIGINILFPPFFFILAIILVLASFGKSLGIRKLYVKALLQIFELVRKITVHHEKERRRAAAFKLTEDDNEEEDDEDETDNSNLSLNDDDSLSLSVKLNGSLGVTREINENSISNLKREKLMKNYGKTTRHNVISRRDNLILNPDGGVSIPEESEEDVNCSLSDKILSGRVVSASTFQREFELDDVLDYVKTGIASVIEDEVTQRFVAEELKTWNLLTRTSSSFEFVNLKLTVIWIIGFFVRYFILLPGRLCILLVGSLFLLCINTMLSFIPGESLRRWCYKFAALTSFRIIARSISAVINFHNTQYRPKSDGICVANHTTPIDVVILSCDNSYALVGQSHGGALGIFQRILGRATSHMWFERSELKDRLLISKRLREHVEDANKLPVLIFPEGTCINNTSVMQFKKGSFEVGGTIYPVAIKYDPKFGDAFWNSSQNGMVSYIYMMMTSWAIVCDVWYLPPMKRLPEEDAITFANRVKSEIARQGGLVDLMWDGNLKRAQVKSEWKAKQQEEFSKRLKVE